MKLRELLHSSEDGNKLIFGPTRNFTPSDNKLTSNVAHGSFPGTLSLQKAVFLVPARQVFPRSFEYSNVQQAAVHIFLGTFTRYSLSW